ncbi:MAG: YdbH domain-containing protein, partial [Bdellovibrionales bacterium]|nr:YdbH domain-containing protein [Bdellovibrionales bacterium]
RLFGHVNLRYKDKIPTIQGQLQGEGPGWIRYRPPGNRPKITIQSTDNPMDILQGYLYDFAFETLSLQIESDKNYDSIMILNTLGRNPQYVRGKPLKLNIKLEQNILAAVQSMMLTYDLPNKLKEKLEGSEAP